jgi:hypothetical protein
VRLRSLFLSTLILVLPLPLLADTIYTYTGNSFTDTSQSFGLFTTSDSVTGSFTVTSPLGSNLVFAPVNWTAFSFSDGYETITNNTPNITVETFQVSTDPTGKIVGWADQVVVGFYLANVHTYSDPGFGGISDDGGQTAIPGHYPQASNYGDPGTWTSADVVDPTPSTVPEPSSLLLLSTGSAVAFGAVRRRLISLKVSA